MMPVENIEQLVSKLKRSTLPDTDGKILGKAEAAMEESLQAGPVNFGHSKLVKKIAIALAMVLLFAVIGLLIIMGQNNEQIRRHRNETIPVKVNVIPKAAESNHEAVDENVMRKIVEMYTTGDVNGLIRVLNEGRLESKLAATLYLSVIGDLRAIEPLEKLSNMYGGGDPNNPFAIAAKGIKERVAEEELQSAKEAAEDANIIYGWLLDANENPVDGEVWIGENKIETDENGEFEIDKRKSEPNKLYLCLAKDKDNKMGRIFFWDMNSEVNELEIVVEPFAGAAGRIVDSNGIFAAGIKVQVEIAGLNGEIYQSAGGMLLQGVTDANGIFRVGGIAIGLPIILKIAGEDKTIEVKELKAGQETNLGDIIAKGVRSKKEAEGSLIEWNATLSGVVTDANGVVMKGISVSAAIGNKIIIDFTDENGRYDLKGLPRGERIQLKVKTETAENTFDVICDGNDFNIRLVPARAN
jgi:hypothetical protein